MSADPIPINRLARPAAGPDTTKTAATIMLGLAIKDLRIEADLSQTQLAKAILVSTPTVSRLETGEGTPQRRTIEAAAKALKVNDTTYDLLKVLAARAEEPEWFQHRFNDITPGYLKRLLGLESMAISLTAYDVRLVSGLLQIPEYAACLIRTGLHRSEWDDGKLELRLAQRVERQERVLGQAEPPMSVFLMDESVLRRRVGSDEVMRAQMARMRELADLPYVVIRFVLLDALIAGNEASMAGSMAQLQFGRGGLPDLVYSEGYGKADYFSKPVRTRDSQEQVKSSSHKDRDYERHLQLLLRIQGEACASPERSRRMLEQAIKHFS
ncbi:helix-turn-helix domain-containing protein [Streptomyces zhihengii]|uniref:Helix-turn-helix transcriptional regulator n=1 Tax=Streptomyces zhihengii TaxID=1818004 RepID=A0ABS2V6K2_9ACTN|nr:helix-turn-helix transcriptional regulator [Streptomyces zhihengii]MBM9624657.1 helix-turn-helix transcriptional regulator [Streptomyces zhihengii]